MSNFQKELSNLINSFSRENVSNTPDFILAKYLESCLVAFDMATKERDRWYGKERSPCDSVVIASDIQPVKQAQLPAPDVFLYANEIRLLKNLVSFVYSVANMLDDSEELGAVHGQDDQTSLLVSTGLLKDVNDLLCEFDELPDDMDGYTLDTAALVKWALRRLLPQDIVNAD